MMRAYLADLLERLAKHEPNVSSADSVSWTAHREAEVLRDVSMVDELAGIAAAEGAKARRAACYFVIGKIGRNLQDARCAAVLLGLLKTERDKYNIASILDRVAEISKPPAFDLSPVYALLEVPRWLVRHAAIGALDDSRSEEVEARLLQHLVARDDPFDQTS